MYEVIGIEHRQYTNKQGRFVSGYNLYFTFPKRNMDGVATHSEWCRDDVVQDSGVAVGDKVDLLYNRYGKVESIRIN